MIARIILSLVLCNLIQISKCEIVEKYFMQQLDHSESSAPASWKQRYLENSEYFEEGGPVFIELGGPFYAPVVPEVMTRGVLPTYARKFNATLILLEARYYGKSRPTSNLSTDNLVKYHTISDSVADSANFIRWIRSQPQFKNSKIVAFGHQWLGSRIIQNMRNDSNLIDIGVLSSTPVEARFTVPEYYQAVADVLKNQSTECADTVHSAIICFDRIIHGESCEGHDLRDMKESYSLCSDPDPSAPFDSIALVGELIRMFGEAVLFSSHDPRAPFTLEKMCKAMGNKNMSHMDKLAKEMREIQKFWGIDCLEFRFDKLVEKNTNVEWDAPGIVHWDRSLFFARCKYNMIIRSPEGIRLGEEREQNYIKYNLEYCKRLFNMSYEETIANTVKTEEMYGKRRIPSKCSIFITDIAGTSTAMEVTTQKEAGRCNALVERQTGDGGFLSDQLEEYESTEYRGLSPGQVKVSAIIEQWLKTGNCCSP